jgi:hypothetical protein
MISCFFLTQVDKLLNTPRSVRKYAFTNSVTPNWNTRLLSTHINCSARQCEFQLPLIMQSIISVNIRGLYGTKQLIPCSISFLFSRLQLFWVLWRCYNKKERRKDAGGKEFIGLL